MMMFDGISVGSGSLAHLPPSNVAGLGVTLAVLHGAFPTNRAGALPASQLAPAGRSRLACWPLTDTPRACSLPVPVAAQRVHAQLRAGCSPACLLSHLRATCRCVVRPSQFPSRSASCLPRGAPCSWAASGAGPGSGVVRPGCLLWHPPLRAPAALWRLWWRRVPHRQRQRIGRGPRQAWQQGKIWRQAALKPTPAEIGWGGPRRECARPSPASAAATQLCRPAVTPGDCRLHSRCHHVIAKSLYPRSCARGTGRYGMGS